MWRWGLKWAVLLRVSRVSLQVKENGVEKKRSYHLQNRNENTSNHLASTATLLGCGNFSHQPRRYIYKDQPDWACCLGVSFNDPCLVEANE